MKSNKKPNKNGFTLIEIIIVIVIIGILAMIAVFLVTDYIDKAKLNADISSARIIAYAVSSYEAKVGNYTDDMSVLISDGYLGSIPISQVHGGDFDIEIENDDIRVTAGESIEYYPRHP